MSPNRMQTTNSSWWVEDRGLIFDAGKAPPDQRIAFFTSLCVLASGKILAGFQNGPCKNSASSTIRLCRSGDGGCTWDAIPLEFVKELHGVPGSLSCAELVEVAPGRLLLFATWFNRSDPSLSLFDAASGGILPSRQVFAVSSDEGETWSAWHDLPTGALRGCSLTGPVIQWPDGTLAVAFESYKEAGDPAPGHHSAWIVVSRDGGNSFSEPLLVARHPEDRIYYWDQRLCAAPEPGRFAAMFWSHDLAAQKDLNVHFCTAELNQNSIVGAPPAVLPIAGQICAPLYCPDGRLLAFVVNRSQPGTMSLWCSPDGGTNWPEDERLIVHTHDERAALTQGTDHIDFNQYWEDMGRWSFGHPALRLLPDGRLLLAWYAGTPDCMSIHWARAVITSR
jgi:hypothetical protein